MHWLAGLACSSKDTALHMHISLYAHPAQGSCFNTGMSSRGVTWCKAGCARAIAHWSLSMRGDCSRLQPTRCRRVSCIIFKHQA